MKTNATKTIAVICKATEKTERKAQIKSANDLNPLNLIAGTPRKFNSN